MDKLYLLQFACCILTATLALMLACARFQIRWLNKRYEVSRWLLCFSMAVLAFHYVLQMIHGLRAHNDDVGAVVNILFYAPIASLISFSTYNVVCSRAKGRKRFVIVCSAIYLIILAIFGVSSMLSGSLDVGDMLYVMAALFVIELVYCIATNILEMRRHRKIMEDNSGADMLPYDSYTGACYVLMAALAMVLTAAILYRPLLLIFGPFMLLSLFFFTMSFIGYGYNITPSDIMLDEMEEDEQDELDMKLSCKDNSLEGESDSTEMSGELLENESIGDDEKNRQERTRTRVEEALRKWCDMDGFRDSNANLVSICQKMNLSKGDLSFYFECCLQTTFRVWLSDIRFNAAKQMLTENPTLSNDTISAECGFSSHAHLYKIFKAKTGLTPRQWVDSL